MAADVLRPNKAQDVDAIIEPAALDLLALRLRTPLQIEHI